MDRMVPEQLLIMTTRTNSFIPREMLFFSVASDATSERTVVYVLEESITASTKKAKARLFEGDPFNPLIFYTEGVVEINVKDIGGSLEETVRGDGNIELTENEFIRYQSRVIE